MASRKHKSGFTLIELLVVVSIIALLVSILLPALAKARKQAKTAVCLSRLHSWGQAFTMYTSQNRGSYPAYSSATTKMTGELSWAYDAYNGFWMNSLAVYYAKIGEIRCCPEATIPLDLAPYYEPGATYRAWGMSLETTKRLGQPTGVGCIVYNRYGSYGINWYIHAYDAEMDRIEKARGNNNMAGLVNPTTNWQKTDKINNSGSVPLLADATAFTAGPVWDSNKLDVMVPKKDGPNPENGADCQNWNYGGDSYATPAIPTFSAGRGFWQFCINRHTRNTNILFADNSARKVPLPDLYTYKWSKNWSNYPTKSDMDYIKTTIDTWAN